LTSKAQIYRILKVTKIPIKLWKTQMITEIYTHKKKLARIITGSAAIVLTLASTTRDSNNYESEYSYQFSTLPTSIEYFENLTPIELRNENEEAPPDILEVEQAPPPKQQEIEITTEPTPIPKAPKNTIEAPTPNPTTSELSPITGYYCQYVPGFPRGDGGGYCNITASGKVPQRGMAACGPKYPLGTAVNIQGYGTVVCEDRGHLAYNQVDIFFPTNAELYTAGFPLRAVVTIVR